MSASGRSRLTSSGATESSGWRRTAGTRTAPAERDRERRHLAHLLGDPQLDLAPAGLDRFPLLLGRGEARLDEAEGNRVDVDLELAPLLGDRLREAGHSRLCRRVVRLAGVPH